MTKSSLFLFCVLCGVFKIVCCGNEPPNLFGLQLSSKPEPESSELADNGGTSEDRSLEKRRLFFADGDMDGEIHSDQYSINGEYSTRRRSDQSQEEQQQLMGGERALGGGQWDERSKFQAAGGEHVGSAGEFRPKQPSTAPNLMYDWERSDVSAKSHSRWDEGKNFEQIMNSRADLQFGNPYSGRPFGGRSYPPANNGNFFDKRISITTLNDEQMRNSNKYNSDYRMGEVRSGYQTHSDMDYQNRREGDGVRSAYQSHSNSEYQNGRDRGFWEPKLCKPEKGVIINFNTDCPAPRQFNSQLVQRVVISPKSPVGARSEVSTYQFPGPFISAAHQLSPAYYM